MGEIYERVDDYLHMGVHTVWIIDPRLRNAYSTDAPGTLALVSELVVKETPIRMSVAAIFEELDEMEENS